MKERGKRGALRGGEHKNKGFKGTIRHEAFPCCRHSRMICADDYGDADSAVSFRLNTSAVVAFLSRTFAALLARRALKVVRINQCTAKYIWINENLTAYAGRDWRMSPNYPICQINEVLLYNKESSSRITY